MRTTLTLDDDLARELRRTARMSDKPFRQVVDETLRAGLAARLGRGGQEPPFKMPTYPLGGPLPGVDLAKTLRLAADLEDAEILRKLEMRK